MTAIDLTRDRRVHASSPTLGEIVRYVRAGKWYHEWSIGPCPQKDLVTVDLAADIATNMVNSGGQWWQGLPGGTTFDKRMRDRGNP